MRTDWEGDHFQMSFQEMFLQFKNTAPRHLLDSLKETIRILRMHPSGRYKGLSSLISPNFPTKAKNKTIRVSINPYSSHSSMSKFEHSLISVTSLIKRDYPLPRQYRRDDFRHKMFCYIQMHKRILGHLASTYCVIFDATGESIITGSDDKLIKIWRARTGALVATLRGHTAEICDLAISPDNSLLASCSCDKTVRIWSTKTSAELYVLHGHTSGVTSIKFSPYSPQDTGWLFLSIILSYLISTGNDACLCFWKFKNNTFDVEPQKFYEKLKNNSQLVCSSFSSGGNFLVVGSSDSRIYIYLIEDEITKIADLEEHNDRVDTVEFNHCGEKFLSASRDGISRVWYPRSISTWSSFSLSLTILKDFEDGANWSSKLKILNLAWNLNDQYILGSMSNHSIVIWCPNAGDIIRILKKHIDSVFVIDTHPLFPNIFMSAGHDGMIIIWDTECSQPLNVLENKIHEQGMGAIFDAKLSPTEFIIAATDSNGHLCIYGFGNGDQYSLVPDQQFFHTDYRPIYSEENITYDEQTGMLPHMMIPPYLVNMDGDPHVSKYQLIHLGRVKNLACFFPGEKKLFRPDLKNSTQAIGLRSVGDVEGVRQTENINFSLPIISEDIQRWKNREIIRPLSLFESSKSIAKLETVYKFEVEFYENIRQSCDPQQITNEERKFKLLSLKSRLLQNKILDMDTNINDVINIPDNTVNMNTISNSQNTRIQTEESSYHTDSEEKDTSDVQYSDDSGLSNMPVNRVICTRRNRYVLQKSDSDAVERITESSSTSACDPIYPHLCTNYGVGREWLLTEKPSRSPYFPQLGDIVVYFLQGHKIYVNHILTNQIFTICTNKLCYNKASLRYMEVCRVSAIKFITGFPYLCSLTLTKMDASGTYSTDLNFSVQFTDITNLDDFIILKQFYDNSIKKKWSIDDDFLSYIDDKWWGGVITDIRPLNPENPESLFRCICVKWNTGEEDSLSPWDIFPVTHNDMKMKYIPEENDWAPENPNEAKQRILAGFETIQLMPNVKEIENILVDNNISLAFPTSFCKISRKCINGFYRRKKSIIWELREIMHNVSLLKPSQDILQNSEILIQSLIYFIKDVSFDVMDLVHRHFGRLDNETTTISTETSSETISQQSQSINTTPPGLKWVSDVHDFLNYITQLSDAQPFLEPMNIEEYPDYLLFVKTPMDFSTISQKLMTGAYLSPDQFVNDIKLLLQNSRLYNTNPRSNIYGMTLRLNNLFNKKIEEMLPCWHKESLRANSLLTRNKINNFLQNLEFNTKSSLSTINISPIKPRRSTRHFIKTLKQQDFTPIARRLRKRKHTKSDSTYSSEDSMIKISNQTRSRSSRRKLFTHSQEETQDNFQQNDYHNRRKKTMMTTPPTITKGFKKCGKYKKKDTSQQVSSSFDTTSGDSYLGKGVSIISKSDERGVSVSVVGDSDIIGDGDDTTDLGKSIFSCSEEESVELRFTSASAAVSNMIKFSKTLVLSF
ncbi:hypothetical protein HZS_1340, partial [Henneguya salminicola]